MDYSANRHDSADRTDAIEHLPLSATGGDDLDWQRTEAGLGLCYASLGTEYALGLITPIHQRPRTGIIFNAHLTTFKTMFRLRYLADFI